MGGVGKTTLAQLVYNDARVDQNFDLKAWVCVSDDFDIFLITKRIVEAVTTSTNQINELNQLQIKLKESLAGKKFLIVLDDVWNDNSIHWNLLRRPFRIGAQESRIIVTTRIDKVALVMGTIPSYCHLKQLSLEDCWSLFAKHAFENGDYMAHPDLEIIGREIVKKCGGLPLAVKSLGGLLRSKLETEEWENILKSEIWDLDPNTLPALRLSYHYLPSHLKRCFAYCSIFPKDYKFEKERLVHLWIALDLVQQPKNNILLEDAGNYYFRELLSRSFFQKISHNTKSDYVMHGLIHDLAQQISREFCFRLEDGKPLNHVCEKVRHFSYAKGVYDGFEKFKAVNEVKYLRTLISFDEKAYCFLGNKVLRDLLPSLRCLRVLSLSHYWISELPQSIENLILLRYLDVSWTKIRRLPDAVTTLCNLQILDLSYCRDLTELPLNMGKLINLRYLDVRGTTLTEMPIQLSRLKNLQHLTYFVVGKNSGSRSNGLKELCHLRGELLISGLQNMTSGLDASEANLKGKEHLEGLEFKWDGDANDSHKERDVLDRLQPHARVKDLRIINYGGTRFPNWLERTRSFHNMVSLKLIRCGNCYSLPSIGQLPSLKYLRIEGMKAITKVSQEFYGDADSSMKPFQSLETLSFKEMEEWEEWDALGAGEFSRLLELSLVDCSKLTGELPSHVLSLRKIEISGCQQLVPDQVRQLLLHRPHLEELNISDMSNFMEFQPELCNLMKLERLTIKKCPSLVSFLDVGLPSLAAVPKGINMNMNMMGINNCLQELRIYDCSSLLQLSFLIDGLPAPTLKTLEISSCSRIEFSLTEHNHHTCSIENLIVYNCDLLKSLSLGLFPKLRYLKISGNINFETLSIRDGEELQNLMELKIDDCPKMVYFPHGDGGRLLPAPNLTYLRISFCNNLKSLPQQMHTLLPSLERLYIWNCPEVESFPDGGLPSNLTTLWVCNCEKLMKGRIGWGLQTPSSLKEFDIWGEYEEEMLESFPEEWLLPTTITTLWIAKLPNLKSVNHKGLQHLTSLTSLYLHECPKLQSLPKEGLPNSLSFLQIQNCPLLKPRCQRDNGKDWPKISQIPWISLDGEDIINLE
ncbi:putative disease resistance protein At3g14460 [Cornus florida]|uniref:putative disease resistance protein At3g14460 n=1 Tax=Cornus florida TaxID=4283 RepID=UPI0028968CC9|nr:putative disease resistance protein At3g14460 [Cornus florida]